jgi:aspartyl-tRNA(Asn)/glutamyl-tRNA(Gln) amidotransferase subunit A
MNADIVRMLAVLAGIDVPTEDEQGLVKAFDNVLASAALLQPLDLSGIDPVVTFDPRWDYLGHRDKAPRAGEADSRTTVPDLQWCGIGELSRRFRRGEVSSARVTDSLLGRIIETEHRLHAYVNVMADSAMRAAEAADAAFKQGRVRSFLQGVPIAVKDLCETKGVPTGAGSHVMDGFVPARDAEVVRHLRDAGAVLVGKTVTHEFAYGQNMPETRNAWDQSCYPGGSSAGSGVAVAAGTAYGAVGTDTGGSIRVPASVNGVVGLKPTFDRVSRVGVFPMSPTLDTVGPITRSVEDAALMLDVMAGGGTADPNTGDPVRGYLAKPWLDLRGVRIGVERGYFFPYDLEEDVRSAVETAIELFRELGASVVDVEIEHLDLTVPAGTAVLAGDTSEWHQRLL